MSQSRACPGPREQRRPGLGRGAESPLARASQGAFNWAAGDGQEVDVRRAR